MASNPFIIPHPFSHPLQVTRQGEGQTKNEGAKTRDRA